MIPFNLFGLEWSHEYAQFFLYLAFDKKSNEKRNKNKKIKFWNDKNSCQTITVIGDFFYHECEMTRKIFIQKTYKFLFKLYEIIHIAYLLICR